MLKEVLVVDNEPIINWDGTTKNDCERNAGKRLLANLKKYYARQDLILTIDVLYTCCAPIIRQIKQQHNWHYQAYLQEDNSSPFV